MKKLTVYFVVLMIFGFSACNNNKARIVGFWKIYDIDDGRNIPAKYKATILADIKSNNFIDIRKDNTLQIEMGETESEGTWKLNDDCTTLEVTKKGANQSESMIIDQLNDSSLILERKVQDRIFKIVLKK